MLMVSSPFLPHYLNLPLPWKASTNTQVVGRQVAFFVNELKKHHGVDLKNVYLIGFSLGAQVAGFAGKFSQSEVILCHFYTNEEIIISLAFFLQYHWKFSRITGLDAAAPMFENHQGSHLIKTDADFVDGIHTSAGKLKNMELFRVMLLSVCFHQEIISLLVKLDSSSLTDTWTFSLIRVTTSRTALASFTPCATINLQVWS